MSIIKTIKNNKTLTLVFSLAALVLLLALVGNKIIEYQISNWSNTINERIIKTEKAITQILTYKQQKLLLKKDKVLSEIKNKKALSEEKLITILTEKKYKNLVLAVIDDNRLVAWNEKFITELKPFGEHHYKPNEVFFINTVLTDYLIVTDTIGLDTNLKLFVAKIVEKKYKLSKEYFNEVSLTNKVRKKLGTDVELNYIFDRGEQKDGRKHSFKIFNNYNNVIAQATFVKPSRAKVIKKLDENLFTIQSILILLGYLLLGSILLRELKNNKSGLAIFFSISFYLIVFRYLLIYLNFPQNIFTSELLNKTYYSTGFGKGIATSPIDLGITAVIFLIISYLGYRLAKDLFKNKKKFETDNILKFLGILFLSSVVYAFAFRGFSAAIRGIIFDSSIRYFQSTKLTPTLPQFVMHINLLLIGVSFIFLVVALILLILHNKPSRATNKSTLLSIAVAFAIVQLVFTFAQTHPLSNLVIKLLLLSSIFIFVYLIVQTDIKRISKIIAFFSIGSVLSIVSLLNFNTELERRSLKSIATLVTRANENWYKKIISEIIKSPAKVKDAEKALKDNIDNYDKYAFLIWSNSKLQTESINSSVNFISTSGELIGGFGSVYPKTILNLNDSSKEFYFIEEKTGIESQKIIRGIKPVKENNKLLGYFDVSILSDINDLSFEAHPKFISSGKLDDIAILSLNKIKILDYQNGILKNIYGEVNPSDEVNKEILNADYSHDNEAWLEADFNSGKHLIYAKKIRYKNLERILAVGLRNKDLSFSLFDFFKIFFSHSMVLLLIMFIVIGILLNKKREYLFDLRTQLLISFLIISLLPLIFLALYFRNMTEEKNDAAIYYKLGKRAFNVESYINEHTKNITELDSIFVSTSRDLNINYSIFDKDKIIYSSQDLIYEVDLIPSIPHPKAAKKIFLDGFQEVLVKDAIDKFKFNSFYYKANILNKEYIIKVADAFNKILLPLSGTEVDVFLFGTYSLAVIFIIMLSAYLANLISAPIRELTLATKSVASGDLNLEIETNAKAEIKELVEGFQFMVSEIKKKQAMLAEVEREEAWKEMAKQVAHEIKNPLTPMKLSIQQLITAYNDKSEKFDKFFNKVTTMLLNQIETLKNIATEFSNFARMPRLKIEKINCIKTVNEALNLFAEDKLNIIFKSNLSECLVNADSEQFKRTIVNLIKNSKQAGADKIVLSLNEDELNYTLRIIDNGKGIKKEYLDKIFEPNFTTKQEGMGLGLSMARRYFNSTGGKIIIEETNGNGTTIKITLPK